MLSASQGKYQTIFNAPPTKWKKSLLSAAISFFFSLFSLVSKLFASPSLQTERGEGKKEFSPNPPLQTHIHTQHTHSTHTAHTKPTAQNYEKKLRHNPPAAAAAGLRRQWPTSCSRQGRHPIQKHMPMRLPRLGKKIHSQWSATISSQTKHYPIPHIPRRSYWKSSPFSSGPPFDQSSFSSRHHHYEGRSNNSNTNKTSGGRSKGRGRGGCEEKVIIPPGNSLRRLNNSLFSQNDILPTPPQTKLHLYTRMRPRGPMPWPLPHPQTLPKTTDIANRTKEIYMETKQISWNLLSSKGFTEMGSVLVWWPEEGGQGWKGGEESVCDGGSTDYYGWDWEGMWGGV